MTLPASLWAGKSESKHPFSHPVMQSTYIMYIYTLYISICSIELMRDEKDELPANFLHELYKWALECK